MFYVSVWLPWICLWLFYVHNPTRTSLQTSKPHKASCGRRDLQRAAAAEEWRRFPAGRKKEKRNQDYSFDSSFITAGSLHYSHNPPRNVKQKKNCLTKKLPKAELKMAAACTNTHSVYHFGDTAGLIWPANLCVCVTSLPPTALVRITAEETGGGMQLTVCNLGNHNNHRVKKRRMRMKQIWVTACLLRGNCEDGGMFFTNEKNKTKQCNTMSRKQVCRWEGLVWDWDDHIRNMSPLWCHKDQKKTAWNKEFRAVWSLELLPHRKNVYRSYKSIFYLQLMIQFYLF